MLMILLLLLLIIIIIMSSRRLWLSDARSRREHGGCPACDGQAWKHALPITSVIWRGPKGLWTKGLYRKSGCDTFEYIHITSDSTQPCLLLSAHRSIDIPTNRTRPSDSDFWKCGPPDIRIFWSLCVWGFLFAQTPEPFVESRKPLLWPSGKKEAVSTPSAEVFRFKDRKYVFSTREPK